MPAGGLLYRDDPDTVVIDLTEAHIWDASTVAALDAISTKYESRGKSVEIIGLNTHSATMHSKLSGALTGKRSAAPLPGCPSEPRQ